MLVISDAALRESVRELLEADQYVVHEAISASGARSLLDGLMFDAALLDRQLPDGDVLEFCRDVKKAGILSPGVIILGVRNDPDMRLAALRSGADTFLGVPVNAEFLKARLGVLVRSTQASREYRRQRLSNGFLAEASQVLSNASVSDYALQRVVEMSATGFRLDFCGVFRADCDGRLALVASMERPSRKGGDTLHVSPSITEGLNGGIIGGVANVRQVVANDLVGVSSLGLTGVCHLAVFPLQAGSQVLGALVTARYEGDEPFASTETTLIADLAGRIALALANIEALETADRLRKEAESLSDLGIEVLRLLPSEEAIRCTAEPARALTRSDIAVLWLIDDDSELLRLGAVAGWPEGILLPAIRKDEGLVGLAISTGASQRMTGSDLEGIAVALGSDSDSGADAARGSLAVVPVAISGQVRGALVIGRQSPRPYDDAAMLVLSRIASVAALAVEYGQLYRRTDNLLSETRAVQQQMADGLFLFDAKGRLRDLNAVACELFGIERQAAIGRTIRELEWLVEPLREADSRRGITVVEDALSNGSITRNHEMAVQISGRDLTFSVTVSPIRNRDGDIVGAVGLTRDITDEVRAREHLVRGETLRALGQMAGGVAHDFNNALGLILGRSDLLIEEAGSGPIDHTDLADAIGEIRRAALDVSQTVRRLQEFSQRRVGGVRELVDASELLREAAMLTRPRWHHDAARRGIVIDLEIRTESTVPISGVPGELREALINLIFNAVDALPEGGRIVLSSRLEDQAVVLEVRDTGQGVSEEVRLRAFEPFFTTKGERGSGLGLAMVHSIVGRHGGTATIDNAPGGGSIVALRFPITSGQVSPNKAMVHSARKSRVAAIDDEIGLLRVLERLLRFDGHDVSVFLSGEEAVANLAAAPVDLVLTDLGMPGMTGWEVARHVKSQTPETKVILVTGWGAEIDSSVAAKAGVDAIIAKPFEVGKLREAMGTLLGWSDV